MSIRIIEHAYRQIVESYVVVYRYTDWPDAGFSFPCDKQGNVYMHELTSDSARNLADCKSGALHVEYVGIEDRSYSYFQHAIAQCYCGARVELAHFTNDCYACMRSYNSQGQLLKPYESWIYED